MPRPAARASRRDRRLRCDGRRGPGKLYLSPDLVLLDMELPDGSGADVLRHIREQSMPAKVCVLTGSCQPHEIESLATLQPEAILIKPYPIDDLLDWVVSAREA